MRLAGAPRFIQCVAIKMLMTQAAPAELRFLLDERVLRGGILVFAH